jgi:hypothetical protein
VPDSRELKIHSTQLISYSESGSRVTLQFFLLLRSVLYVLHRADESTAVLTLSLFKEAFLIAQIVPAVN